MAGTRLAQHGQAAATRQVQVEQHGIKRLDAPEVARFVEGCCQVYAVAGIAEAAQHDLAEHRVVFNQKDAHRRARSVSGQAL